MTVNNRGNRATEFCVAIAVVVAVPLMLLPPLLQPLMLLPHIPSAAMVGSTALVASTAMPASLWASVSAPADAVVAVCGWASSHGTVGLCAFAAVHAAAVVVCFPATILFELAAGFAFGVYQGAALAWTAKVAAALITFLASSGIARTLLSNAGVEAAAERAFAAQPSLTRLAQNVEQESARYLTTPYHTLTTPHDTSRHLTTPHDTSRHLTTPCSLYLTRAGWSALHLARAPLSDPIVAREPPPLEPECCATDRQTDRQADRQTIW